MLAASQKNRANLGTFAANNKLKFRVVKVEEAREVGQIPLNKRVTDELYASAMNSPLAQAMEEGKAKIVFVTVQVKNASSHKLHIGWNAYGYRRFFLRGDAAFLFA